MNSQSAADKPQVKGFVNFYVANVAKIAEAAQFIPLNDEQTQTLTSDAGSIG